MEVSQSDAANAMPPLFARADDRYNCVCAYIIQYLSIRCWRAVEILVYELQPNNGTSKERMYSMLLLSTETNPSIFFLFLRKTKNSIESEVVYSSNHWWFVNREWASDYLLWIFFSLSHALHLSLEQLLFGPAFLYKGWHNSFVSSAFEFGVEVVLFIFQMFKN